MTVGEKKGGWRNFGYPPAPLGGSGKSLRGAFVSGLSVSKRDAYSAAFLALIVAVCYFPAVHAGFVWDDVIITKLRSVSDWEGIRRIWLDPVAAYFQTDVAENHYWPVVYTTFWIEHKLWGFSAAGYHVVNILLHFANTLLLWRLLARLAVPGALFAAAVFAAHPLHAESVAWVMGRKDLLSALFYLAAVSMWLRHVESPRPGRYAAALLLFAAAMLSKSIAITLPAALLVIQWWRNGRVTRADMLLVSPFFLIALVIGGADLWFFKNQGLNSFDYSLAERILAASQAFWFYIGKLLWPMGLSIIYPLWEIRVTDPLAWGYAVAVLAAVSALWVLRGRIGRGPLACVLFFGITLSPTLGFIDFDYMRYSFVADRYQYLAGIGITVLFVTGALRVAERMAFRAGNAVTGIALVVLVLLGSLTWTQAGIYKDEITFFTHVTSLNPRARGAHYNMGLELSRQGRFKDAEEYFRRSLDIYPRDKESFHNLGEVLRAQGKYEESLVAYRSAIDIAPGDPKTLFGMGNALFKLRRYSEAVLSMERALALAVDPSMESALRYVMGQALLEMGRLGEAEAQFGLSVKSSLLVNPRGADAFFSRAELLRGQKRYEEALRWYRLAVETEPGYASAYAGMGDSLYRLGRYREAISGMERAVSLRPGSPMEPTLYYLMGQAAREAGWLDEAAGHYQNALLIAPHFTEALNRLADVRFEQKRYEQALLLYKTLVGIGSESAITYNNIGVALLNVGKAEEAVWSFERALSLDPALESARIGLKRAQENASQAGE